MRGQWSCGEKDWLVWLLGRRRHDGIRWSQGSGIHIEPVVVVETVRVTPWVGGAKISGFVEAVKL